MRVRTAVLVLRLGAAADSWLGRRALRAVLRAAESGATAALRAVSRAMETHGAEAVFRSWLTPSVSGPSPRRWASPLVAGLESSAPVPAVLVDAAWLDWLDRHGGELWSLLERWGAAPATSESRVRSLSRLALGDGDVALERRDLVDAALRFDHPIGERARARLLAPGDPETVEVFCAAALDSPEAARFCAGHHLAPADQVRRALFFVRTGQSAQYRALDPDGSILALGYRGAGAEERSILRAAMSGLGILDVLRVLAGQSTRQGDFASLDESERAHVIGELVDRRDWDRLWSLTLLMSLPEAVGTADEFGDWRPSGEDDRRLFEALRAADPSAVTRFVAALAGTGPFSSVPSVPRTRIWPTDTHEESITMHALDFATDCAQLAFAGRGTGHCAGIVDLDSLTLAWVDDDLPQPAQWIAHLGRDAMIVAARKSIHYADESGTRALGSAPSDVGGVVRVAGDRAFMVPARHRGTPGMTSGWAMFVGGCDGPLADGDWPRDRRYDLPRNPAADAEGRVVALVHGLLDVTVADLADSTVNTLSHPETAKSRIRHAALSPSALVCNTEAGDLHVWHEPLTSSQAPLTTRPWRYGTSPIHLAWSPALDRFLAVTATHLELLDLPPTQDTPLTEDCVSERVRLLADRPGARARCARVSPRGDLLAVGDLDKGAVDIYVLTALALRPFIAEPMGAMNHKDLAKVVEVMENQALNELSRQALGLLRACLEHRFRHDVGIGGTAGSAGSAGAARLGDYEIELDG
ncbi:hypothetical protein [Streptomyces sp. AC512_CC834]|uniref:hypothetical protein n=1 Tax=Streptomyces sp. AC512_CC834 TaxID=2823691 RepID=UPI001C2684EE|nr:hypothetical protein [Streptomyces sp. AC512_CC834]